MKDYNDALIIGLTFNIEGYLKSLDRSDTEIRWLKPYNTMALTELISFDISTFSPIDIVDFYVNAIVVGDVPVTRVNGTEPTSTPKPRAVVKGRTGAYDHTTHKESSTDGYSLDTPGSRLGFLCVPTYQRESGEVKIIHLYALQRYFSSYEIFRSVVVSFVCQVKGASRDMTNEDDEAANPRDDAHDEASRNDEMVNDIVVDPKDDIIEEVLRDIVAGK
ncbi:hypothetical protein Dimus_008599 [Dionaea muscipula]